MSNQQVLEFVENEYGESIVAYLRNKNIGGKSGSKGVQYENFYAVYHIAILIPLIGTAANDRLYISTQTLNFVDDLIVEDREVNSKRHYQLKNSKNVAWGAGQRKICDDFKYQKAVNDAFQVSSTRTCLVVPDISKTKALRKSIPADISEFSSVECFGFGETLSNSLQVEPKLYNALAALCVEPEPSKVDRLGALFVGEWVSRLGEACTVAEVWEGVKRHEPNYLAFETDADLSEEVRKILVQIPGFTFRLEKGFFVWQYGECDSGGLDYPVTTEEFSQFQLELMAREPRTFAELEEILI